MQQINKFRISARKLFLTYSQVDPQITALHVLEQLQCNTSLRIGFKYVIAKEYHKDGGTHFHVIIVQQRKVNIRKPHALDIQYQKQNFHGNYVPVKSLPHVINYVCKNNQYITNFENLKDGRLMSAKQFIISQVEEKGIEQALIEHYKRDPENAIAGISVSALKKQFDDIQKIQANLKREQGGLETPFNLENFNITTELQAWIDNPEKTLLIVGNSGIGKTQFCRALAKQKKLKTLLVNHKEDFRRLNNSYECIILDDANLQEFEETQLLSVVESQVEKTIRVLYDSVIKKANLVQMIAINQKEFQSIAHSLKQPRFARRILLLQPKTPFMINVNINIINNFGDNNTNIVNQAPNAVTNHEKETFKQEESFEAAQLAEQLHIKKTQETIRRIVRG